MFVPAHIDVNANLTANCIKELYSHTDHSELNAVIDSLDKNVLREFYQAYREKYVIPLSKVDVEPINSNKDKDKDSVTKTFKFNGFADNAHNNTVFADNGKSNVVKDNKDSCNCKDGSCKCKDEKKKSRDDEVLAFIRSYIKWINELFY